MTRSPFPSLDTDTLAPTRDAVHAYARILGGWLGNARDRRKHWWHSSLRVSLRGLTTGVIYTDRNFELELDLFGSQLRVITAKDSAALKLEGQPSAEVASWLDKTLSEFGVDTALAPGDKVRDTTPFEGYSPAQARSLGRVFAAVDAQLETFRAEIREETSPIQLWPHHFDLSMIWLPGPKVPDQDPADEEYADKQMNFGFVPGDATVPEPYFYVTAYPLPDALPGTTLPPGTEWKSDGFSGAVLLYSDLARTAEPGAYLQTLWTSLLTAGRSHLVNDA